MPKRYSKKQIRKRIDRECFFCGEKDYNLLDVHRIIEGKNNGKYVDKNMVVCCAICHRKVHSGRIRILGRHFSTLGRDMINYIEDGIEKWK